MTRPSFGLTLVVTWFGSGLSPKAPGTMGSLAALPFAALMAWVAGPHWAWAVLITASIVVFVGGWIASERYVRLTNSQDPSLIVIDEVVGMWLTLAVAPFSPLAYAVGFGLFRLFDIAKPFPIGWADRRVKGGLGVMLDDVLAATWAAMLLYLARVYLPLPW